MHRFLRCNEVEKLVGNSEKLSKLPEQIAGNTIYVLQPEQKIKDGYKWVNYGVKTAKEKGIPIFYAHYFISENDSNKNDPFIEKFTKKVYIAIQNPLSVIVQYIGDEAKGIVSQRVTPKSILNLIDEKVQHTEPSTVYCQMIGSSE
ncbi:unnamed protein product, partial [Didymodactylos carnosus]